MPLKLFVNVCVPDTAFQSDTITTIALFACVVVRETEGLPLEPFALLLFPTPSLPENLTTLAPKGIAGPPTPANEIVIVSPDGATYPHTYAVE